MYMVTVVKQTVTTGKVSVYNAFGLLAGAVMVVKTNVTIAVRCYRPNYACALIVPTTANVVTIMGSRNERLKVIATCRTKLKQMLVSSNAVAPVGVKLARTVIVRGSRHYVSLVLARNSGIEVLTNAIVA